MTQRIPSANPASTLDSAGPTASLGDPAHNPAAALRDDADPALDNPGCAAEAADPAIEADVFARNCTSRPVLQNVASRWGTLALVALLEGPYRFSALRRRVDGVSERMLSQTLQTLERDGMIHREVHETIPPRVEYTLTDLGAQVATNLLSLVHLLETNMPAVRESQSTYHRE